MLVDELSKVSRVTEVKTYKTVCAAADYSEVKKMLTNGEIDYITFTSSSTVDNFADEMGGTQTQLGGAKIISIGPITSERIAHYGMDVYAQAKEYTIKGILEVLTDEQ